MKKLLFALLMVILITSASATQLTDYFSPGKDTTYTAGRTLNFRIGLDVEESVCKIGIGLTNGNYLGNYTMTKSGKSYNYTNTININDSTIGAYHNYSIFCGDTSAAATLIETVNFKLRVARPTATRPTANGIYGNVKLSTGVSCTVPVAISTATYGCWYNYTVNGVLKGIGTMSSADNLTWVNSSTFTTTNDSINSGYHNITFLCNDTSGQYESENIGFKVDSVAPIGSMGNFSVSAGTATVLMRSTDNNTASCSAQLINNLGAITQSVTGSVQGTGPASNCSYSVTGDQIGLDGTFQLEGYATDSISNVGARLNKSGVVKILYTGWNLASWADNATNISNICNSVSGCSILSKFDNVLKTFTSFTAATPSVNGEGVINPGEGFYIYVPSTAYLIMNDNALTLLSAQSTGENISLRAGWNLYGLTRNASVNRTYQGPVAGKSQGNITFSSDLDGESQYFTTCGRDTGLCTGTSSAATALNLPRGSAVWVLADANFSVNRTGVTG